MWSECVASLLIALAVGYLFYWLGPRSAGGKCREEPPIKPNPKKG